MGALIDQWLLLVSCCLPVLLLNKIAELSVQLIIWIACGEFSASRSWLKNSQRPAVGLEPRSPGSQCTHADHSAAAAVLILFFVFFIFTTSSRCCVVSIFFHNSSLAALPVITVATKHELTSHSILNLKTYIFTPFMVDAAVNQCSPQHPPRSVLGCGWRILFMVI